MLTPSQWLSAFLRPWNIFQKNIRRTTLLCCCYLVNNCSKVYRTYCRSGKVTYAENFRGGAKFRHNRVMSQINLRGSE